MFAMHHNSFSHSSVALTGVRYTVMNQCLQTRVHFGSSWIPSTVLLLLLDMQPLNRKPIYKAERISQYNMFAFIRKLMPVEVLVMNSFYENCLPLN